MSLYKIDERNIKKGITSRFDKELFFLFTVVVAGKVAAQQTQKLANMLDDLRVDNPLCSGNPFDLLRAANRRGLLRAYLEKHKLGQYGRLMNVFSACLQDSFDVCTCTLDDLESIAGVGPKTSRFFLSYTRPGTQYAILDTHVLAYMRDVMGLEAPRSTPPLKLYRALEMAYLTHAAELNRDPAELDLDIWREYSSRRRQTALAA